MNGHGRTNRGFSLVELLVASTLGLILTSGVVSVFVANRQSSDLNSAIANMQESARYALDAMASDLRHAGFMGCASLRDGVPSIQASDSPTASLSATFTTGAVIGAADAWAPSAPTDFVTAGRDAVPGTHALSLQFADTDNRRLRAPMAKGGKPSPAGVIKMKSALPGARAGDLAIIANCEVADLFRITKLVSGGRNLQHKAAGNSNSGSLDFAYGGDLTLRETTVSLFRANVYYVARTGQQNENGDEILALYQQSWPYDDLAANPPVEIVAGVENLRVAFGIRQPDDRLRYVPPDSPQYDPRRVESVRIGLMMSSRDRIAADDDDRTYLLAGQAVAPGNEPGVSHAGDKRHRLVFNTTVKVRNRRLQ